MTACLGAGLCSLIFSVPSCVCVCTSNCHPPPHRRRSLHDYAFYDTLPLPHQAGPVPPAPLFNSEGVRVGYEDISEEELDREAEADQ